MRQPRDCQERLSYAFPVFTFQVRNPRNRRRLRYFIQYIRLFGSFFFSYCDSIEINM